MNLNKIKGRTYASKILAFIIGLVLGWIVFLFLFSVFTPGEEELSNTATYISMILSFISMVIYTIIADHNYLKRLEFTTSSLFSNISIYKKREQDLLVKSQEVITQYLEHESDVQKTVAVARSANTVEKISRSNLESLNDLKTTVEKYPDLKADKQIHNLFVQIEESQNAILAAKLVYNEYVTHYNAAMLSFPAVMFVTSWKLKPMNFYEDSDV